LDRVRGLALGADDYMTKPTSIRELQARVGTQRPMMKLLRWHFYSDQHKNTSVKGNLQIGLARCQTQTIAQVLALTATEFKLLQYPAKHANKVFSTSQWLELVWGHHHIII
jgi:two-component system, OmpR family, alkaline phosphatase synthesis response regulator PhoP